MIILEINGVGFDRLSREISIVAVYCCACRCDRASVIQDAEASDDDDDDVT